MDFQPASDANLSYAELEVQARQPIDPPQMQQAPPPQMQEPPPQQMQMQMPQQEPTFFDGPSEPMEQTSKETKDFMSKLFDADTKQDMAFIAAAYILVNSEPLQKIMRNSAPAIYGEPGITTLVSNGVLVAIAYFLIKQGFKNGS